IASEFVQFKLFGTVHVGDQIRDALNTPAATLMATPGHGTRVILDKSARFALYILVDGFLFEGASVREALLQLVNAIFGLGIAVDHPRMMQQIRARLAVTDSSDTGLEEWIEPLRQPDWLARLITLRNTTTHRYPLRLPARVTMHLGNPAPEPPADV